MGEGDLELLEDRPTLNCSHPSSFPQQPFQALSYSCLKALLYSSGLLLTPHALQIPRVLCFTFILMQVHSVHWAPNLLNATLDFTLARQV